MTKNNPTDEQLKRALVRLLPDKIKFIPAPKVWDAETQNKFVWLNKFDTCYCKVVETEWLHVCHLIEQGMSEVDKLTFTDNLIHLLNAYVYDGGYYQGEGELNLGEIFKVVNATWQQRALAIIAVKGIEV